MSNLFFLNYLQKCLAYVVYYFIFYTSSLALVIAPKNLINVLFFLKKNSLLRFRLLMDILAVDKPHNRHRFFLVYKLDSIDYNYTIFLNTNLAQNEGISSALEVFSSAGWLEREIWDFFGIYFYNHNDLRRILTDYGFSGFPFRKDFPLSGYFEVYYMDEKKRVVLEPLDISQEFRFFDFNSPWEINK